MTEPRDTHTPNPPTPEPRTLAEAAPRPYDASPVDEPRADESRVAAAVRRNIGAHLAGLRYLEDH